MKKKALVAAIAVIVYSKMKEELAEKVIDCFGENYVPAVSPR